MNVLPEKEKKKSESRIFESIQNSSIPFLLAGGGGTGGRGQKKQPALPLVSLETELVQC